MPVSTTQYKIVTMNVPVDGSIFSNDALPSFNCSTFTLTSSLDLHALSNVPGDTQTLSPYHDVTSYTDVPYTADQVVVYAPGHEPGYTVDVQGITSTKHIRLKGSLGSNGDTIVRTPTGPEWQMDYYSTIYNLEDARPVDGTYDEGNNYAVVLDPRNGFTQYYQPTSGSNSCNSIILPNGLPPDRRWAVRLELQDPNGWFFWQVVNNMNASTVTWIPGMNDLANPSLIIDLYEFYTRDGGNNWIAYKYHGGSFD